MKIKLGSLSILVALYAVLFAAQPAIAKDVRFPATGDPAFSVRMPDDWTTDEDDPENLLLTSGDSSTTFSLLVDMVDARVDDAMLERLAKVVLKGLNADPTKDKEAVSISGFPGFSYAAKTTNKAGVSIRLTLVLVRIGEHHLASCTKMEAASNSTTQMKVAGEVFRSMRLSLPR